eukprot:732900-Pleurochrysis_carterae.AAC.1
MAILIGEVADALSASSFDTRALRPKIGCSVNTRPSVTSARMRVGSADVGGLALQETTVS